MSDEVEIERQQLNKEDEAEVNVELVNRDEDEKEGTKVDNDETADDIIEQMTGMSG